MQICGFAATNWIAKVKNDSDNKKQKTNFSGREDYFSTSSYFIGSDVGNALEMIAGSYSYPFSCVIPANVPASMESKYGHIRYVVRVSLERPWKHNITYQALMTVKTVYDLNLLSERLSFPAMAETVSSFYFGLTEPLTVSASIPRSGYAPGEIIELKIHVNNHSIVDMRFVSIKLKRIDTFISQVPRIKQQLEHTIIEERQTGRIPRRQSLRFEENILIGSGSPSDDTRCHIIHTRYEIEIVLHPVRSRKRPTVILPVTLGTLRIQNNNIYPNIIIEKQREALLGYAQSVPSLAAIEQAATAPPSYLELPTASSSRAYSISSNMTVEELSEDEGGSETEPITMRDY
ncbi:arrestin domain-containing protein 17-like isoform X2 [Toxorhynchites rutilus septentrionalis]|nr:arrestin domain-containing protein 17-like isoform X2 [Toxorhynchites rutilus septentrionalis]